MAVRIDGLNKTVKALVEAGVEIDDLKDVFSSIAKEGAQVVEKHVPKRSGALAKSVRGNRAKNSARVTVGRAKVRYAGPINYGWKKRNIAPSHFVAKADREMEPRIMEMLESGLNDMLKKKGLL